MPRKRKPHEQTQRYLQERVRVLTEENQCLREELRLQLGLDTEGLEAYLRVCRARET